VKVETDSFSNDVRPHPHPAASASGLARRDFLGAGSALIAAALAGEDAMAQTIDDTRKAEQDRSATDAGPENTKIREANPNTFLPPPTDHGETPTFWNTFSTAHRRIQEGGWSRQITVEDFPLSKDIAAVNMRLTAGGVRELHWHNAGEWAIMLSGNARITAIDNDGKSFVDDVTKDDLWFFPSGNPHSIQGLGPDGCEFLLVFDDGKFSEANTTLISDWARHTPPQVLAKNWSVNPSAIAGIYQQPAEGHYIFQIPVPGPLAQDLQAAAGNKGASPLKFSFSLSKMAPTFSTRSGSVKIVDTRNFPVSTTIAAAHVTVKPGGMRELHWHQNADEWQYFIQGSARMTVFFNGGKARTADFNPGDVGLVPKTFGHYVENTGSDDLIFLEMFKADRFMDLSLSDWVSHTPPELITQHLGIGEDVLRMMPKDKAVVVPI
jgi:oxalate decarboxylase